MGREIAIQELTKALQTMPNNKSPGKDGLTKEFYKTFWNNLAEPLTEVANWNYTIESMSPSQREALLKLLYKKNTKEHLKNWRPTSLLNIDYKIIVKALSLQLRNVLPSLVNPAQTCSIPNRSIQENIAIIRDIIHHTNGKGQAIVISVDQEKAFNRVDQNYMYGVLEEMNFGKSFTQWIKTLYDNASAAITNGWTSDPVFLQHGLRQGWPLSPLLYILTVEPLVQTIRANKKIQGIHIPGGGGKETKLAQYVDDMNLILANKRSVTRAFEILKDFQQVSGSKLNPVRKAEQHMQMWSLRKLTIRGCALIAKTFGITTFLYLLTCFTAPKHIIEFKVFKR